MQSWCRTWPPNGSSHIRAKRRLLRKHKGACKSSWSQIGSLKSFTLTIPWNLADPVKIFPGIVVRRHHTDPKQNGIAERAIRRVKEGTSAVLLQSSLDEKWWADSMECYCYLRNIQDLLSDGENTSWTAIWRTTPRTNDSIWFTGWVSSYFCQRPVTAPPIWQESFTWNKSGICIRCREPGTEIFWSQTLRSWKFWTRQKFMLGAQCKGSIDARVDISYSPSQMEQLSCLEEMKFLENPT